MADTAETPDKKGDVQDPKDSAAKEADGKSRQGERKSDKKAARAKNAKRTKDSGEAKRGRQGGRHGGKPSSGRRFATPVLVISVIVALVVGVVGGILAYKNLPIAGSPAVFSGSTTLSEDQLDTTIATYTYKGETYSITAREAIEENSSITAAANDDGTYNVPSADTVLATARYLILDKEATDQGISVSDEEMSDYAKTNFGSDDYATIATTYNMDEDQVKEIVRQSTAMKKLHDQVVQGEEPVAPTAPTAPEEGAEDTPTEEYAQYIIDLVGDEWDSENNTWARTDGDYYAALSSYTISNDSATYDAAEAAYVVASQKYSTAASAYSEQWTNYVNGLLADASVDIYTLVVSAS